MNAHHFTNTGDYLRDFLRALNRATAVKGRSTFLVEVLDEGLSTDDLDLLR